MVFFKAVPTDDGSYTVYSQQRDECYHSISGAFYEARRLYIDESKVSEAFASGSAVPVGVLDVGLGLGYNALATIEAWAHMPAVCCELEVASLECYVELIEALASGESSWQKNWPAEWVNFCRTLKQVSGNKWVGEIKHPQASHCCNWNIYLGDATKQYLPRPASGGKWDYIWQDPFSPKKNPDMWNENWFSKLRGGSSPSTQLLTYSCSRVVKDNLSVSGWDWSLIKAPGKKKNWLKAVIRPD
ncbi:MAG: MnmC family methyltransferase [Bdellovibrionota bacterium]